MDACRPRRPLPAWLRFGRCGCGAGAALLVALLVHTGLLTRPWLALVAVAAELAVMLLLP